MSIKISSKMKFALLASVFLFLNFCSAFQGEISPFVINGEDATIEEHPYMAHVHVLIMPMCGASILSERTLLTAAHCLYTSLAQPFLVSAVVGSSYRDGRGGTSYRASRIFMHPDYEPGPNVYDIAILRTLSRITFNKFVQPIALHDSPYIEPGTFGVFTGWGFVGYGALLPQRADIMQRMYTMSISNDDCRERYNVTHRGDYIFDQKLCVTSGPRTSVCGGDSGGPLVIDRKVAGVISWRTFPCGDGLPDVFIRISAVRDWIYSVLV